jgi:hypothetical protein
MKHPLDRIRGLEDHYEALESALEKIKAVTFEPKQTLPAVKRRIAKILLAVRIVRKSPPKRADCARAVGQGGLGGGELSLAATSSHSHFGSRGPRKKAL